MPLAAAFVLASCTVGPDYSSPAKPQEQSYTPGGAAETAAGDQHFALGQKIAGDWWTLYRSEPLRQVLEQAIAGSRTLASAQATLAAALEQVTIARGALYPQADLGASAQRERNNGAALGLARLPPQFPTHFNVFRVGPTVSYAVDVFGGTRRAIEESEALADVQEFQLDAAYLALTGNAVTEALTIASLNAQIATVEGIIRDDQTNLDLVQKEVRAGVATQLDIETATSQLAADRTQLPPLRQQVSVAQHALAVLVGRAPGDWVPPDFDLDRITLPEELPLSLPSALVRQRPDILAADARLHAASAAVGVATAQLYPSITLSAASTQQSISLETLFHGASTVWNVAGGLTAPIFHGGELEAQRRRTERVFDATLADYEQTVLQAFGQVADVLEALSHDAELLADQQRALASAQASLDLTRRSYAIGSVGILQVLDAQRLVQQARLGYVRAKAQRYLDTAQLFVAMGGGWWDWRGRTAPAAPDAAPAPTPISAPAPAR
ncbi:MAG TPA: efflux transporter outer membrane subunit [Stellaceae bacterium]|nr:efflux transporter outer membrane subunit [Stellaceae bacterium]